MSLSKKIISIELRILFAGFGILLLLSRCNINDSTGNIKTSEIKFLKEYELNILEPSGLTFNSDYTALYTVSDNSNRVYKIDLQGNILEELSYNGNDLEGITFDKITNTLWVAEEKLREVVNLNLNGKELQREKINLSGSDNNGLEGICLDTSGVMFLLNEKKPKLFLQLNKDFTIHTKKEITQVNDLSGITYDSKHKVFWIVSDESRVMFQWSQTEGIQKSVSFSIDKAEGIAYNSIENRLYIVSDKTNKLYIYQLNN